MRNEYVIDGDVATVSIKRNNGKVFRFIIDTEDLPRLVELGSTWKVGNIDRKNIYVITQKRIEGKCYTINLSRYLMNTPKELQADHINHDTLDNRKCNLRNVTMSENLLNRRPYNIKSARKDDSGVHWYKNINKYRVRFMEGRKSVSLGYYDTLEEANAVAKQYREQR